MRWWSVVALVATVGCSAVHSPSPSALPTPANRGDVEEGLASWYGPGVHGRRTANGEIFDMSALSAAHPTLPLPSLVYVTNMENGRTLLLRVNDRGPYVNSRVIDVSRAAARLLGTEVHGLGHVRVRYAGRAPLDANDQPERQFLASQPWSAGLTGRMALGAAE